MTIVFWTASVILFLVTLLCGFSWYSESKEPSGALGSIPSDLSAVLTVIFSLVLIVMMIIRFT